MNKLLNLLSVILLLQLGACGGGASAPSSTPASKPITGTESATQQPGNQQEQGGSIDSDNNDYAFLKGQARPEQMITSAITGISYPVNVYLPEDYDKTTQNYPIIYALDGQTLYPGLPYLLEQEGVDAILVAISEGPEDRRRTDYLLPGARNYFSFLTVELIPYIESGLRVDTEQRTLVGASFGGVLTALAMLMDDVSDPAFYNYLAFDASFYVHQAETQALVLSRYLASDKLNGRLFLSSAVPEGNDQYVTDFEQRIRQRGFTGLEIIRREYQISHSAITEPSFREAVSLLLKP